MGKNTIYEKQVVSVIANFKRKSNYAKGKLKTFPTQPLLIYGYSFDSPFRLELTKKAIFIKTPGQAEDLVLFGVMI